MPAAEPSPTPLVALGAALERLRAGAPALARLPLTAKAALARRLRDGMARVAGPSALAASRAKGIPAGSPLEGEEWISGPFVTLRLLRQVEESLEALARGGSTPIGPARRRPDGRFEVEVFPETLRDRLLFPGVRAAVRLLPGAAPEDRARFHRAPDHAGRVCLILGGGNINSIPTTDVVTKLFKEGKACLLKLSPVNAYLGPFIEAAFADAVAAGFLAVVQGGAAEGEWLARHAAVDEVHVTGSDRTHDLLVWGPPGPERDARQARGEPLLAKEITSELGNVSPVIVVPGPYTDRELAFQAESIAGMVTHNASFNCNAAKMLVTPSGWSRREELLDRVFGLLEATPPRRAWYPGAEERYASLTAGRVEVRRTAAGPGALPWTLLPALDAGDAFERAFRTEPFCSILSEVPVGSDDPVRFLEAAVEFCNQRLWGTLNASLVVPPAVEADPGSAAALEAAIDRLRYGTVAVNVWPGFSFSLGSTPWGAYPGSPLADIQSGRGFVHDSRMLEGVEKCVVRAPVRGLVKLPYFPSYRTLGQLGPRLAALEASDGWIRLPAVLAAGVRG
ncbi:MAG TPA: aldehyde dehydrogenase [Anaeromyxobacteraceae bacterium]|jgi:aldehyde dehydrogenase (NAD(P)+)|nr:aldehyde dehydrogenase [Anaeromyxobacteraceae bacterium]